ncbi:hypothetical protein PI125_g27346, partial [Phytophthora idaei]
GSGQVIPKQGREEQWHHTRAPRRSAVATDLVNGYQSQQLCA